MPERLVELHIKHAVILTNTKEVYRDHILSVVINSQVLTSVSKAKEQVGYFLLGTFYILGIHVKAFYVLVCLLEHNGEFFQ